MKRTFLSDTLRYDFCLTLDAIRFTMGVAEPDKGFRFILHSNLAYSELDSCHFQESGNLRGPFTRSGEWYSRIDHRKMPMGLIEFVATETTKCWCATSSPYAKYVTCATGEVACQEGTRLLLLTGPDTGTLLEASSAKDVDIGFEVAFKWNPAEFDLVQPADMRWEAIKRERELQLNGGFTWSGYVFDSDSSARANIMDAAIGGTLNPNVTYEWTLKDNSVITLSGSEMVAVAGALGVHIQTAHAAARLRRNENT